MAKKKMTYADQKATLPTPAVIAKVAEIKLEAFSGVMMLISNGSAIAIANFALWFHSVETKDEKFWIKKERLPLIDWYALSLKGESCTK